MNKPTAGFDAHQKEQALRAESQSWDTSSIEPALPGDIPVIDVTDYFAGAEPAALEAAARLHRARALCRANGAGMHGKNPGPA